MTERFRGSFIGRVDDRGRIKIPALYLEILEKRRDRRVYLTSVNGDNILFYPLAVWAKIEERIERMNVRDPDVEEYISRISYWGSQCEIDPKGRILVPADLRAGSQLQDEVLVLGKVDYLVLWNKELFKSRFVGGVFSDERLHRVSRLINEQSPYPGHE